MDGRIIIIAALLPACLLTPQSTLRTPKLVKGSIGPTDVMLEWTSSLLNVSVQWRIEGEDDIYWFPGRTETISGARTESQRVLVRDLYPYTSYSFRLATGGQYGPPLSGIVTKAGQQPPLSPPRIISVRQLPQKRALLEFLPPIRPNAQIHSFPLEYSSTSSKNIGTDILPDKDKEHQSYILGPLECNETYTITLQAKNLYGRSGKASTEFTARCTKRVSEEIIPWAVLVLNGTVFKKDLRDPKLFNALIPITQVDEVILSMDLHQEKRLLYIVTESGRVLQEILSQDLGGTKQKKTIHQEGEDLAEVLTVDWLHDNLYILKSQISGMFQEESWYIEMCDLDGGFCERVTGLHFTKKPKHLKVDPYHGYLYWVERSQSMDSLVRVNMTHTGCSTAHPQVMLKSSSLGPPMVSFEEYSVYIPVLDRNRIFKISLTPAFKVSVVYETLWGDQAFHDVEAILRFNNKFYWTSSEGFNVEYTSTNRQYSYSKIDPDFTTSIMLLHHPSSQPFPVPINPIEDLQVVFDYSKAEIKWSAPLTGLEEGCASYKAWRYRIQMNDEVGNIVRNYENITMMKVSRVGELTSKKLYSIRVQAYSQGGSGPWSPPFSGRTLTTKKTPAIFWADHQQIHKIDLFGSGGRSFTHNSSIINSIVWLDRTSTLLWSSNDHIFTQFDNVSRVSQELKNETSTVGSMVYENLGQRLYYSVPGYQEIRRMSMSGEVEANIAVSSAASNLMVDSALARLCWISLLAGLECSQLDGSNHTTLYQNGIWSDEKILSATLDPQNHDVYFITYNPLQFPKYVYHRKSLVGPASYQKLGSLSLNHLETSLYFTSGKLIFLEGQSSIVTFDMEGNSISRLSLATRTLSFTLSLELESLFPKTMGDTRFLRVIPSAVDIGSMVILEQEGQYRIEWGEVNNTNYGHIVYEVKFKNKVTRVANNSFNISDFGHFKPYQPLQVSIRATTAWASSAPSTRFMQTPESVPSEPRNLRVFWSGVSASENEYTVRWAEPEEENGKLLHHTLRCVEVETERDLCPNLRINFPKMEVVLSLGKGPIRFTVAASTSRGEGAVSPPFLTASHSINPTPFLILGVRKPPSIIVYDVDKGSTRTIMVPISPHFTAHDARTQSVFIVNNSGELYQLSLKSEKATFIRKLDHMVSQIYLDWVGRYLYFVHEMEIRRVDLENHKTKVQDVFTAVNRIKSLDLDSEGRFYYSDTNSNLFSFKLSQDGNISEMVNFKLGLPSDNSCNCADVEKADTIKFFLHNQQSRFAIRASYSGDVFVSEDNFCRCRRIGESTNVNDKVSIRADRSNIYIFSVLNNSITSENINTQLLTTTNLSSVTDKEVVSVSVLCNECQTLKDPSCMDIRTDKLIVEFLDIRETSAMISLPIPQVQEDCNKSLQLPSTNYTVGYRKMDKTGDSLSHSKSLYNLGNFGSRRMKIENLEPNSNYSICVNARNYYSKPRPLSDIENNGACTVFTTDEGASSPPTNMEALVLSPSDVLIAWSQPSQINSDQVNYEIHWNSTGFIKGVIQSGNVFVKHNETKTKLISNLPSNQTFQFWMYSVSPKAQKSGASKIELVKTFSKPNLVNIDLVEPRRIDFSWTNTEESIAYHQFLYFTDNKNLTDKFVPDKPISSEYLKTYKLSLHHLSPSHCYTIKVVVTYKTDKGRKFLWPKQGDGDCVMTEKDKPLVPGTPNLNHQEYSHIAITWRENEEAILQYELQEKTVSSESKWKTIYNDSSNQYIASGLPNGNYTFRVRAFNRNGFSDFSSSSIPLDLEIVRQNRLTSTKNGQLTIGITAASVVGGMLVICILYFIFTKNKFAKKKKSLLEPGGHKPDLELANLRELPIRGGFINANNPMYNQLEIVTDADLEMIPKIKRSQISLTKFLGSGAFGEVYEGLVKELDSVDGVEVKRAVKTLRKGATDSEKLEFLKEAKLMFNFKHEHILSLNAICLDNDPNFLILELMEGGDLLSFLRAHRPKGLNKGISLLELIEMCSDVAKGCEYLEAMHFVHRDLAARNCLVSSTNPSERMVKIGDFGLARDIYKNDYYRKEGEGLLPVRWMAPESLTDGVFTTQSDVWSFGVLLWEILTMGGIPYPTLSNRQVMLYVRSGRRLEKPPGSPQRLHELMESCWCYQPNDRPTFKMCAQEIGCLLEQDNSLSSLSTAYLTYMHQPGSGSACSQQHFHSATTVPASQASRAWTNTASSSVGGQYNPTYLQLLHEEYEVPRRNLERCSCSLEPQSLSEYGNVRISHSPDCMSPPANFQETSVPFQGPLVSEQGPSGPQGPLAAPQSPSAPSQGPMAPAESQDPLATLEQLSLSSSTSASSDSIHSYQNFATKQAPEERIDTSPPEPVKFLELKTSSNTQSTSLPNVYGEDEQDSPAQDFTLDDKTKNVDSPLVRVINAERKLSGHVVAVSTKNNNGVDNVVEQYNGANGPSRHGNAVEQYNGVNGPSSHGNAVEQYSSVNGPSSHGNAVEQYSSVNGPSSHDNVDDIVEIDVELSTNDDQPINDNVDDIDDIDTPLKVGDQCRNICYEVPTLEPVHTVH